MNKKKIEIVLLPGSGKQLEIKIGTDTRILISYTTPVAACILGKYYKTGKFFSTTTSKQIGQWIEGGQHAEVMEQSFFDALMEV